MQPLQSRLDRQVPSAADSALAVLFQHAQLSGLRDPAKIAKLLLEVERLLALEFPVSRPAHAQRPLLFVLADRFLVQLRTNKSDEISQFVARLFRAIACDTGLLYTVQTAILAMVGAESNPRLGRRLAPCELDADLYVQLDGSKVPESGQVLCLADLQLCGSLFSPISGFSAAKAGAAKKAHRCLPVIRENPDFEVWEFTLTMPERLSSWADYEARRAAKLYTRRIELFVRKMRATGMRQMTIGREVAFHSDHVHPHLHIVYLGLRPDIAALQAAWEASCWPKGKPVNALPLETDFRCIVESGRSPNRHEPDLLTQRLAYCTKGRYLPAIWTVGALRQWADFVRVSRHHPRRSSTVSGPGVVNPKRNYERERVEEPPAQKAPVPAAPDRTLLASQAAPNLRFAEVEAGAFSLDSFSDWELGHSDEGLRVGDPEGIPNMQEHLDGFPVDAGAPPEFDLKSYMSMAIGSGPGLQTAQSPASNRRFEFVGTLYSLMATGGLNIHDALSELRVLRPVLDAILSRHLMAMKRRRQRLQKRCPLVSSVALDLETPALPQLSRKELLDFWDAKRRRRQSRHHVRLRPLLA
ncbi:MAG: hypothetical protein IPP14_05740 [Planctomycetes bacterium]|nr:hypothetical protein [Planctomycetota bacterium]